MIAKHLNDMKTELESTKADLKTARSEFTSKVNDIKQKDEQISALELRAKDLDEKLKVCKKLALKYEGLDCDVLTEFGAPKLLGKYIKDTSEVNKRSVPPPIVTPLLIRNVKDYFKEKHNNEDIGAIDGETDLSLDMNHILFYFMRFNIMSLMNIVDYPNDASNPVNLRTSYGRSIEVARSIRDADGSLAWYINQLIPSTYVSANSVTHHLRSTFDLFIQKHSIDVRRIHLFYPEFFTHTQSNFARTNIKALFTTLLLEFLHGVDSRVLCVKNYEKARDIILAPREHEKGRSIVADYPMLLLDFALYFSIEPDSPSGFMGGIPRVLCANFMATEMSSEDKLEQERTQDEVLRTREYERQRVYDFDNPMLYGMFKTCFLSLWNLGKYRDYLSILKKEQCPEDNRDLGRLVEVLDEQVEVWDFARFWNEVLAHKLVLGVLDKEQFSSTYHWDNLSTKLGRIIQPAEIDRLSEEVLSIVRNSSGTELGSVTNNEIKSKFSHYILRDIHNIKTNY
jgi:hypothetical protein